jgi:hypothetical protein
MNREDQLYVLGWALDFMYVQMNGLRPEKLLNLLTELDAALSGVLGDKNLRQAYQHVLRIVSLRKQSPEAVLSARVEQAKRLQERLRTFSLGIFQKIKKGREEEETWLNVKEFEELFYLTEVAVKETILRAVVEAEHDFTEDGAKVCWSRGSWKNGIIKIGRSLPDAENALIFHFLEALDDLPLDSLQECPECGHWFILSDRKRRKYCSQSCQRKKANRDYHEKKKTDIEAHEARLAEKQEKAHAIYAEGQIAKIKAELGEDARVKIGRRPRKRKQKEE